MAAGVRSHRSDSTKETILGVAERPFAEHGVIDAITGWWLAPVTAGQ
ncbi:hypothetical protein ACFRKB_21585 [Streptomyces scopuliridis]